MRRSNHQQPRCDGSSPVKLPGRNGETLHDRGTRKTAAKGRRTGKLQTKIAGQFIAHRINMLQSPAWCALSLSGRRVLDRIEIEHAAHGGAENGRLPVTYDDFEKYGMDRHAIGPAMREAVALGFIEITEVGRAGNAEFRKPNQFRLTYLETALAPTDEWQRIQTGIEAAAIAKAARQASAPKKQNSSGGKRQVSVLETPTENRIPQCRKPPLKTRVFPVPVSPTTSRLYPSSSLPTEGAQSAGAGLEPAAAGIGHNAGPPLDPSDGKPVAPVVEQQAANGHGRSAAKARQPGVYHNDWCAKANGTGAHCTCGNAIRYHHEPWCSR
jgi:hypothetical protein